MRQRQEKKFEQVKLFIQNVFALTIHFALTILKNVCVQISIFYFHILIHFEKLVS